jgi:cystathionine beta-lyase family protein involved in aluminum resistance
MATYTHAYAITFEIVDHGNLLDAVGAPYDTFEKKEV